MIGYYKFYFYKKWCKIGNILVLFFNFVLSCFIVKVVILVSVKDVKNSVIYWFYFFLFIGGLERG